MDGKSQNKKIKIAEEAGQDFLPMQQEPEQELLMLAGLLRSYMEKPDADKMELHRKKMLASFSTKTLELDDDFLDEVTAAGEIPYSYITCPICGLIMHSDKLDEHNKKYHSV